MQGEARNILHRLRSESSDEEIHRVFTQCKGLCSVRLGRDEESMVMTSTAKGARLVAKSRRVDSSLRLATNFAPLRLSDCLLLVCVLRGHFHVVLHFVTAMAPMFPVSPVAHV
jgi:hypothetical protein